MKIPHAAPIPIAECPDEVLEQIAHAGDCAITDWPVSLLSVDGRTPLVFEATRRACTGGHRLRTASRKHWPKWRRAARWAARKLGVEVK